VEDADAAGLLRGAVGGELAADGGLVAEQDDLQLGPGAGRLDGALWRRFIILLVRSLGVNILFADNGVLNLL